MNQSIHQSTSWVMNQLALVVSGASRVAMGLFTSSQVINKAN
jgi:hypothetical protein